MLQVMKTENMRDWESLLGVSVYMHTSLQNKQTNKQTKNGSFSELFVTTLA